MVYKADLGKVAEKYFKLLFTTEDVGVELEEWNEIQPSVTAEQNEALMQSVTREEVRKAVFDINPHKCPGPDGMNGHFGTLVQRKSQICYKGFSSQE